MKITNTALKELIKEAVEDYLSAMRKSGKGRVISSKTTDEERRQKEEDAVADAKLTEVYVSQMLDEIKVMFNELPSVFKHRGAPYEHPMPGTNAGWLYGSVSALHKLVTWQRDSIGKHASYRQILSRFFEGKE